MSDWIEWNGGECPVDEDMVVEVQFRNGNVKPPMQAGNYKWDHGYPGSDVIFESDIIAYRIAGPGRVEVIDSGNTTSALSSQVGGSHYKDMPIQPVEFVHKNGIGYMEGCAIKYLARWRNKNGIEDLKKAKHFIELLIEMEEHAK